MADNFARIEETLFKTNITSLSKKVKALHDSKNRLSSGSAESIDTFPRDVTSARKKRIKKLKDLSGIDKIDMVYKVVHGKEKHADVAE